MEEFYPPSADGSPVVSLRQQARIRLLQQTVDHLNEQIAYLGEEKRDLIIENNLLRREMEATHIELNRLRERQGRGC